MHRKIPGLAIAVTLTGVIAANAPSGNWSVIALSAVGIVTLRLSSLHRQVCSPKIMNTDHGSQFTSFAWTNRLRRANVRISMDGKGWFLDNIFVERLWRSRKYECVYLHAWETRSEMRVGVGRWIEFYNRKRPHSALGDKLPPTTRNANSPAGAGRMALYLLVNIGCGSRI